MKAALSCFTTLLTVGALTGCGTGGSQTAAPGGLGLNHPPQGNALFAPAEPSTTSKLAAVFTDNPVSQAVSSGLKKTSDWFTSSPEGAVHDATSLAYDSPAPGADLYIAAAGMYERGGDLVHAAEQYEKALEADPKNQAALLGAARLYDRQDKFEQAIRYYQQTLQHHPKLATAHNDLGLCYARQAKYQESLVALRSAVQLEPTRALYRNNIATVLAELGQNQQALEHLTVAHGRAKAHYNLGYLLYQRGQHQPAAEQFQLALRSDPQLREAELWLAKLAPPAPAGAYQLAPYQAVTGPQVRTASLPQSAAPQMPAQPRYPQAMPQAQPAAAPQSVPPATRPHGNYQSLQQPNQDEQRFAQPAAMPPLPGSPASRSDVVPASYESATER